MQFTATYFPKSNIQISYLDQKIAVNENHAFFSALVAFFVDTTSNGPAIVYFLTSTITNMG